MKIYRHLYVSQELEEKREKVLKKLRKNSLQPTIYVLALSQGGQNNLEFFSSVLLKQKVFAHTPLFVVGIAKGYDDALFLVEQITKEVYDSTKGLNIRQYILDRQNEYEESRVHI